MVQDQSQKIEVLIAEKSSYARLVLENILAGDEEVSIKGLAADGDELISMLKQIRPEVLLLNNSLPKNNRLFTVKRISSEAPTPIVLMVKREELTLSLLQEVLNCGVYAILVKPEGKQLPNYRSVSAEILAKVKSVRQVDLWNEQQRKQFVQHDIALVPDKVNLGKEAIDTIVVIGASTGGTQAIEQIIKEFGPESGAAFVIAVHLPSSFTNAFAKRLQVLTPLQVEEGKEGMALVPNKVIVAPGGKNMIVQQIFGSCSDYRVCYSDEPVAGFDQPSIDLLMESVARTEVKHVMGVILTGMGTDGTLGASCIQERGGVVIAQNQETSAMFGMAKSAIASGIIKEVLPLAEIPHYINQYVARNKFSARTPGMTHEIERTGV